MVVLASKRLIDGQVSFRAPLNMMYHIDSINFANLVAAAGVYIIVVGLELDERTTDSIISEGDIIGAMVAALANDHEITDIHEETKWIGFTKTSTSSVDCFITVHGRLIPASRKKLLMEWFRKSR